MGVTRAMKAVKKAVKKADKNAMKVMKAAKPTVVKTNATKAMKTAKNTVKAKPAMKPKTVMKATIATKDIAANTDMDEAKELQPYDNIVEAWPIDPDAIDVD